MKGIFTTLFVAHRDGRYIIDLNIEKIIFKFVQIKFLAIHFTNTKLNFDIFTVGNLQNIFMEHDLNI